MRCIYLRMRIKNKQPYWYCKNDNNIISLDSCKSCLNFILKANKPIKTISNKRKKLEQSRKKSKRIDSCYCYYCHRYCPNADIHEIYGGSNRRRSIENDFVVNLCRTCHSDEEVIKKLRIKFQKIYENKHTREEFIKLFGKSYIIEEEQYGKR